MATPSISDILNNTLNPDQQTRETATQQLEQFAATAFPSYIQALASCLSSDGNPSHTRNSAGLALKNSLTAKTGATRDAYAARWTALESGVKENVKNAAIATLASQDRSARGAAGQVVAAVAAFEIPLDAWPDLVDKLCSSATQHENTTLRQAALQAIGYVCEATQPEYLARQSNKVLTAVVQGARKEEANPDVQLAAIQALLNSLEFIKGNFDTEGERNYIMQVVCEATQSTSVDVQIAAFECLVGIMSRFYDKMQFYMERALFGLTTLGMKNEDERVALQAIEFWSTVCDVEIERGLEAEEAAQFQEEPDHESRHFAKIALPEILPVLLLLLTRQEDDVEENEWNTSMAAGTCLSLLAQAVGDGIVTPIIPFVEANIKQADWHRREAAVMAFGSILDGPDSKLLQPLVTQALGTLIEMMTDADEHVKDTTAWTLARICDVLIDTIKPELLPGLVQALVQGLSENNRMTSNCCWGLMNLAEQLGDITENTCTLSPFYPGIADAVLAFSSKPNMDSTSRNSGYEALSALVNNAAHDCLPTVQKLALVTLERAEQYLQMSSQLVGADDRNNYNEIMMNLCALMTSVIRRLGKEIKPLSDRIMTLLLQIIQSASKSSPVLEDAFLCIGALISTLETDFSPYLQAFFPYLSNALRSHQEYQLCSVAVNLIGDICRALGEGSAPFAQDFMTVLLEDLQSTVLHRSVKPLILSCFGDIALAVGPAFEPYLETTITVLQQAGSMQAEPTNFDLVDYVTTLRESVLEAFTGVVSGMKSANKSDKLLPYTPIIFSFLQFVMADHERSDAMVKSAVGLLGDIAEAFPKGQLKAHLQTQWVDECVKAARSKGADAESRQVAKWAKEMIRRATQ